MIHELKIEDDYASKVVTKEKAFEVRFNDRDYKKGDYIHFLPVRAKFRNIIAAEIKDKIYEITYVLTHEDFPQGIKEGYAVLAMKEVTLQQIRNETAQQQGEGNEKNKRTRKETKCVSKSWNHEKWIGSW